MGVILLILLVALLVGTMPTWPYSRGWGYSGVGSIGFILIILVVLLLLGRI